MELPRRYLEKLAEQCFMEEFKDKRKVERFAKGIGDSLELIGEDESRYIIEHSYKSLFVNFNKDIPMTE